MNEATKNAAQELKEKLTLQRRHLSKVWDQQMTAAADRYAEGYKAFLNAAKTEREAVAYAAARAEQEGYRLFKYGTVYKPGDKVYYINRNKAIILAVIGRRSLAEGCRIAAAHIDSPRIDLKPNPVYEDSELALFKTHYYGGIKKYQWTTIPLALHGRIVRSDGSCVDVCIGENDNDPVFCITDLLPHLATEQLKRTLNEGVKGEELNVVAGSRPFESEDEDKELVKLNVLRLLYERFGITEEDFISAELSFVPQAKARDIGFDRSLIGSYGHDDRVCAYPALTAIFASHEPEYTVLTVLADKEEIGSLGNTGLDSDYLRDFITALSDMQGVPVYVTLSHSECLSADVNVGFDPSWPDVLDRRNCAYLNYGVVLTKYTGARGKSGTSDASAEFMGRVRRMLNERSVPWQIGELGKVDLGGGGTVAMFIAGHNIDVVDLGVPVLSMHAPFEIVSKLDVYSAYQAFCAFFAS